MLQPPSARLQTQLARKNTFVRWFSNRPHSPKIDSLDRLLRLQDPQQRIAFLPKRVGIDTAVERFGSYIRPETLSKAAHLVPFWTLLFLCDVKRGYKLPEIGWAPHGKPRQSFADIGCSIAAVSETHWCSGLVLVDDMRTLVGEGTNSVFQSPVKYNLKDIGYDSHKQHLSNPVRAPKFAHSFPKLNSDDLYRLSLLPQYKDEDGAEVWDMVNAPMVYAVPTYRIAYKLDLRGDQTAYVDGFYDSPSHQIILSQRPGKDSINFSWTAQTAIRYNARKLFDAFHTTNVSRDPLLPSSKSLDLSEMLVRAMKRNPINWDDASIVPVNAAQSRTCAQLVAEADARILLGLASTRSDIATTPEQARTAQSTTSKTQAQPQPGVAAGRTRTNLKAADTSATLRLTRGRQAPSRHRTAPSLDLNNLQDLIRRIRKTIPPSQLRLMANKKKVEDLPKTPTITRIADPQGFYKLLDITPTVDFVDRSKAGALTDILALRRRALAVQYHPDAVVNQPKDLMSAYDKYDLMARINVAWDTLRTVEGRIAYSATSPQ